MTMENDIYNGHCNKCAETFSECRCMNSKWFLENSSGEWFSNYDSGKLFTKNPLEAKAFPSMEDVDAFIKKNNLKGVFATEHLFI